ncbi:MAG: hypothetical protein ACREOB_09820 [Thermodesulfobacteriota bacterium]
MEATIKYSSRAEGNKYFTLEITDEFQSLEEINEMLEEMIRLIDKRIADIEGKILPVFGLHHE